MHVIDGQAGLILYASLIFYSLTIDNILNIIVLLILAGISIAMLSGNNGILQRATDAKNITNETQIKERIQLAELAARTDGRGNLSYSKLNEELAKEFGAKGTGYNISDEIENPWVVTVGKVTYTIVNTGTAQPGDDGLQEITASTPAGTVVVTPNNWTTLQGNAISDGNGTAIPLPTGFYYVGGDYNTGLVISDKENDTIDASGTSMGNQFVWIPVPNEESLTRTEFNSSGVPILGLSSEFSEPYNFSVDGTNHIGYSSEENEYNSMRRQVLLYKGFYIGRYEAGINTTEVMEYPDSVQNIVCKKGVSPVCAVWDTEYNEKGIPITLSQDMYSNSNSVTSTLIYGCQWDAMCRYIGDSYRTEPNTINAVDLTGSENSDVSKRIYDLAGNFVEYTMEAVKRVEGDVEWDNIFYRRVVRGGNFEDYESTISTRNSYVDEGYAWSYGGVGFRVALYIK